MVTQSPTLGFHIAVLTSFLALSFPLLVVSVMACIECALVRGVLLLQPLLLQLPEQIRRQQSVFHEPIGQRTFHRVSATSSVALTAGQLMAAYQSIQDSLASSRLQRVGHGWVRCPDQTSDIPDTLLDDFIQVLLDLSNHGRVGEHVHEAVAKGQEDDE